jgi:hypothetical protein
MNEDRQLLGPLSVSILKERAAGSSAPACWARPRTRGELRDRLARGETCEVVTSNATITSMMLRGWLQFNGFTVRPSENEGWSLFEPNSPICVKQQERP